MQTSAQLKIPGWILVVLSALSTLLFLFFSAFLFFFPEIMKSLGPQAQPTGQEMQMRMTSIIYLGMAAVSGFNIWLAFKMINRTNYGLAMTCAVMSMIPFFSPLCLLGIPFGIWSLVILLKPEVKAAFEDQAEFHQPLHQAQPGPPPPAPPMY